MFGVRPYLGQTRQ